MTSFSYRPLELLFLECFQCQIKGPIQIGLALFFIILKMIFIGLIA